MRTFKPVWPKISIVEQAWREQRHAHSALQIEIGAGVGMHAITLAKSNESIFVIALERTEEKSDKMITRVINHQPLPNLLAMRADAIQWIWQNLKAEEVAHYYILYPNPYPKASQANQRFLRMPFFAYLLETLTNDGQITLASNMKFYVEEAVALASSEWNLQIDECVQLPQNFTARTHFERKYLARGEHCYNLVMRKKATTPYGLA